MAVSMYAVVAFAATVLGASIAPPTHEVLELSDCGRVWLTVHSLTVRCCNNRQIEDALELNWDFSGCRTTHTRIGLFNSPPTSWEKSLIQYEIRQPKGYIVTNTSLGTPMLPADWEDSAGVKGPHCLWPWIAAGDDVISAYNCLKIQPTWMEDQFNKISEMPIGTLALPGTHNAGAWTFNTELSNAPKDAFVLCQDRSIWAQLVHGIRYLDFRIAYYGFYNNKDDRYWLNHNLIRVRPLVPLLKEIRAFLDATTHEVVILDAHHFPIGFTDDKDLPLHDVHNGLLDIVQRELGPYIADASQFPTSERGPPIGQFVTTNKRLIFSYVNTDVRREHKWLWANVHHLWANANTISNLFSYLDRDIINVATSSSAAMLNSAMAQITPGVLDIILLQGSIRKNADLVNRDVTDRLATSWREHINIVSPDFFLGTDVVDICIAINQERGQRL